MSQFAYHVLRLFTLICCNSNRREYGLEGFLHLNKMHFYPQLYIEKEGIMLAFSPSGVRAPQKPQPAGNGRPAVNGEPFWEEAFAFTRQHMLQREVEVEVHFNSVQPVNIVLSPHGW